MTDRLCRDCRWSWNNAAAIEKPRPYDWTCTHKSARVMGPTDYVMGEPSEARQLPCTNSRRDPDRCGVTGRYWEKRE